MSPPKKSLPSRKSVEFAILPPPPKRSKQQKQEDDSDTWLEMRQQPSTTRTIYSSSNSSSNNNNQQNFSSFIDENSSIPNAATAHWTAKQVVEAISTSIQPFERQEAVKKARDSFNHNVEAIHNDEIGSGADAVMVKHLTFLVYHYRLLQQQCQRLSADIGACATTKRKQDHFTIVMPTNTSDTNTTNHYDHSPLHKVNRDLIDLRKEISWTLDAMESMYRASSSIVGASFERMGQEILNLLVTLVDDEIGQRMQIIMAHQQAESQQQDEQQIPQQQVPQQQPVLSKTSNCMSFDSDEDNSLSTDMNYTNIHASFVNESDKYRCKQEDTTTRDTSNEDVRGDKKSEIRRPLAPPPSLPNMVVSPSSNSQKCISRFPNDRLVKQNQESVTPGSTPDGDLLLRKCTKLLGHLARVADATKTMAHYPGLMGSLINLVTLRPYECSPWDARLSSLWVLANLACNAENMRMMVCTPGLITALVDVASRPLQHSDSLETTMEILRSRSIASRAINNLSWAPENKLILAEHGTLIDLLAKLVICRNAPVLHKSRTVQEILLSTRRYAAGALRNLAAAPRRIKIGLCDYKSGHLLNVMTDAALNDTDVEVQERALATIHNLAIQDTAQKIVNHPALVLALKDVLLSSTEEPGEEFHRGKSASTPREHASATLLVLERSITPDMDAYENLREILDAVNPSTSTDNEDDNGDGKETTAIAEV
jgi:hypothetical protein